MSIDAKAPARRSPVAGKQLTDGSGHRDNFQEPAVFAHLQYLRAVAALMVVFQHSQFLHPKIWGRGIFGGLGVDLFFAISGFVIFATTMSNFSLREYLLKRCIRIIPVYWALTVLMAIIKLAAPELFSATIFRFDHFLRSLLFIPTYTPSRADEITPLLVPGWTLHFEMFFYAVFGVLLFLLRSSTRLLVGITCLFGLLVCCGVVLESDNASFVTYTSPRIVEFLAGVVAAYVLLYYPRSLPSLALTLVLMSAGWILLFYVGVFYQGDPLLLVPAVFLIVYAAATMDRLGVGRHHALLKLLGAASYSIYLVQFFVLAAANQVAPRIVTVSDSPLQAMAFVGVCMVVSVCAGVLLYFVFEVPVLNWLRRALLPARPR